MKWMGDGKAAEWRKKAEEVRAKLATHLRRPEKAACYDRDRRGQFGPTWGLIPVWPVLAGAADSSR